jgi:transposase
VVPLSLFDIEGVVHHEFLREGQTVNRWYYLEVLKRLEENVKRKRPELWRNNSRFLHHDNEPARASLLIRDFLAKMNTTLLPQPFYSPDLAPADFFLFSKLKSTLIGRRFQTIQKIKENSQTELRAIPKKAYQNCLQKWQRRWERCISAGSEYFAGDKAH